MKTEERVQSLVDDYLKAILSCKNIERKINSLINLGSLCYDYNQESYACELYRKALDICLENETGSFPRFKDQALMAARSIQVSMPKTGDEAAVKINEERVRSFYLQRFPNA